MTPEALATLLSDPSRADSILPDDIPEALGQLEKLRATLVMRLTAPLSNSDRPTADRALGSADQLLTVKELAKRLRVDDRWVYRRADSLPFTKRIGKRSLRFSERDLEEWLSQQ